MPSVLVEFTQFVPAKAAKNLEKINVITENYFSKDF